MWTIKTAVWLPIFNFFSDLKGIGIWCVLKCRAVEELFEADKGRN